MIRPRYRWWAGARPGRLPRSGRFILRDAIRAAPSTSPDRFRSGGARAVAHLCSSPVRARTLPRCSPALKPPREGRLTGGSPFSGRRAVCRSFRASVDSGCVRSTRLSSSSFSNRRLPDSLSRNTEISFVDSDCEADANNCQRLKISHRSSKYGGWSVGRDKSG